MIIIVHVIYHPILFIHPFVIGGHCQVTMQKYAPVYRILVISQGGIAKIPIWSLVAWRNVFKLFLYIYIYIYDIDMDIRYVY